MADKLKKLVRKSIAVLLLAIILVTVIIILPPSFFVFIFIFTSNMGILGWAFIIITLAILFALIIIIVAISIPISELGIYCRQNGPDSSSKRVVRTNFLKVFKNNLILAFPLYFTIAYLMNPSNYFNASSVNIDINNAFIAALAIIPGYLLSLRLLTNPVKKESRFFPLILIKRHYSDSSSIKMLKERFISFYFSLTASTFFIMIILYFYRAFSTKPLSLYDFYMKFTMAFIISFIPKFDVIIIILFLCSFIFALFVLTALGELILEKYEPMIDNSLVY